jgi:hypothetical protein
MAEWVTVSFVMLWTMKLEINLYPILQLVQNKHLIWLLVLSCRVQALSMVWLYTKLLTVSPTLAVIAMGPIPVRRSCWTSLIRLSK